MSSMEKVYAPWTAEQVESLNGYQHCDYFHEFTYGEGERLIATQAGWVVFPDGPIVQDWCYSYMCDGSWQSTLKNLETGGHW